jgi:hypothetical protein
MRRHTFQTNCFTQRLNAVLCIRLYDRPGPVFLNKLPKTAEVKYDFIVFLAVTRGLTTENIISSITFFLRGLLKDALSGAGL